MMGWYGYGPGWGGWIVMTVMMLGFWALLVFGGLAIWKSARREDNRSPDARADAERLLDERFARGEIEAEDYKARRELLRGSR